MPTLEGGLRIDAEGANDWELLRSVAVDAKLPKIDLANRLGSLISEEAGAEDWQELIVPDLSESFHDELHQVAAAIEAAAHHAQDQAGALWITPEDAFSWYSALNQARLGLEEVYQFGPSEDLTGDDFPPRKRSAFYRTRFYCAIQSLLLEYVLGKS